MFVPKSKIIPVLIAITKAGDKIPELFSYMKDNTGGWKEQWNYIFPDESSDEDISAAEQERRYLVLESERITNWVRIGKSLIEGWIESR